MASLSDSKFNAAEVADAVFSTILMQGSNRLPNGHGADQAVVLESIDSFDRSLRAAGLSFAEYLDRIRERSSFSSKPANTSWRYSARERAFQQANEAVAQLCVLMREHSAE